MANPLFKTLACSGLLSLAPGTGLLAQVKGVLIEPPQVISIFGQVNSSGNGSWRTYQMGTFAEATTGEGFRVPSGLFLVITQAEVTVDADPRKWIQMEFRLLPQASAAFPLARFTFHNDISSAPSTASRTFSPGLVYPPGALVNVVDKSARPGKFEVLLSGFYHSVTK